MSVKRPMKIHAAAKMTKNANAEASASPQLSEARGP